MLHQNIRDIVAVRQFHAVAPGDTVRSACDRLVDAVEGAVVVMEEGRLVGILGEHDIIARAICAGRPTRDTAVREIMTRDPQRVDVGRSLAEAMKVMVDGGFRHLPVTEGQKVVGILSMRDIPAQYRMLVQRFQEFRDGARSAQEQPTLLV